MTQPICEFRDPDGAYVLVQPFDDVRCRVIASNVVPKGEVLFKRARLSWQSASTDVGGYTRLGPSTLLGSVDSEPGAVPDDILALLAEGDAPPGPHRGQDGRGEPLDPHSLFATDDGEDGSDPRAAVLRLTIHYRKVHEHQKGRSRWLSFCECPGYGPSDDRVRTKLHALLSLALVARKLPALPRIARTIRAIEINREVA